MILNSNKKGFSLIEIVVIIGIFIIILSISTFSFSKYKSQKQIEITIDSISSKLEEAKINALSGKNGKNFGIEFGTSTYIYFSGNSYNPSDVTNQINNIDKNILITKNISGGGNSIIFSRLSGKPLNTGTIIISDINNASSTASIDIGTLGDINVLK